MKTVNSLSGGKTSSYIAEHYPADYNVFALVRTIDTNCMFPDAKLRQIVSDKLGTEFIGTLEEDAIIYTMLDLEQFIGEKIDWVTGVTFDEIVSGKNGRSIYLQN
jgi:diphthamide synthase (EF-2-diphthine--ammonia ligase)